MNTNLELAQGYGLDQWLEDYPKVMAYDQIIDLLKQDKWSTPNDRWKDVITPWHMAEGCAGEVLASFIEDTCLSIKRLLDKQSNL
jgi:hypothetical protein